MKTNYEWDVETVAESGDVLDHNHGDTLAEIILFLEQRSDQDRRMMRLVLVRDRLTGPGNFGDVRCERSWAYCHAGVFDTKFSDCCGDTSHRVPQGYLREFDGERDQLERLLPHEMVPVQESRNPERTG